MLFQDSFNCHIIKYGYSVSYFKLDWHLVSKCDDLKNAYYPYTMTTGATED
jgi:hypothetical protein